MVNLKSIRSSIIIREIVLFAGIFGFAVGVFALVMVAGQQILQSHLGKNDWFIPAFALLITAFTINPIERLVQNTAGKLLFRKRYEYRKALQDAAGGMAAVRDPGRLVNLIVHIVSKKMRLGNVSVLISEDKLKEYQIKASRGERKPKRTILSISYDDPLIEWLKEKKEPLVLDELQGWIRNEKIALTKSILTADLKRIQEKMQSLNASVCVPSFYRDELIGILALGNKKSGDLFSRDDLGLFNTLADEAAIAIKNSQLYFEIDKKVKEREVLYKKERRLFLHASIAFAAAIDARDPYTHGHSERVTNYSLAMLDSMDYVPGVEDKAAFRQKLRLAAVLHDVGKIGVPDDALHKLGRLNPKERKEIEKHPVIGADIISHIKGLLGIVGAIKHHHERYDGAGYPDGLKAEEIPFMARIIAIGDTYDAMTSDRIYRQGLPGETAKEEIKKNASAQFDPDMVATFLKIFEEGKIKGGKKIESATTADV